MWKTSNLKKPLHSILIMVEGKRVYLEVESEQFEATQLVSYVHTSSLVHLSLFMYYGVSRLQINSYGTMDNRYIIEWHMNDCEFNGFEVGIDKIIRYL